MLGALRLMTVERGIDPRGFVLLPFGGAGPLHAAALAERAGHRAHPLPARLRRALRARPRRRRTPPRRAHAPSCSAGDSLTAARLSGEREALIARGPDGARRRSLARARSPRAALPRPVLRAGGRGSPSPSARTACERRSRARTSSATATATTPPSRAGQHPRVGLGLAARAAPLAAHAAVPAPDLSPIIFDGGSVDAAVYRGELAARNASLRARLCARCPEATLLVPPGWSGEVDAHGTVHLHRAGPRPAG